MKKSPTNTDRHVGSRLRMQRLLKGMSQEKLGDALGLTFQQVQKYEKGTNRIGASRLQHIAQILEVAPAFFFEDQPGTQQVGFADESSGEIVSFLSSAEGLLLNKAFVRIKDPKVRRKIVELVTALAGPPDEDTAAAPDEPVDGGGPLEADPDEALPVQGVAKATRGRSL